MIWGFIGLEYVEERLKSSRVNGLMLTREIQFVLFDNSDCLFERVTCTPVKPQMWIRCRATSIIGRCV
jgi:hypothetical protein